MGYPTQTAVMELFITSTPNLFSPIEGMGCDFDTCFEEHENHLGAKI